MVLDKFVDCFNEKNFQILDLIDQQSPQDNRKDDAVIFVFDDPEYSDRNEDDPYTCEESVSSSSEINKFS